MTAPNSLKPVDVSVITDRISVLRYFTNISPLDQAIQQFASLEGEPDTLTDSEIRRGFSSFKSDKRFSWLLKTPEQFHALAKNREDELYKTRILRGLEVFAILGIGAVGITLLKERRIASSKNGNSPPPSTGSTPSSDPTASSDSPAQTGSGGNLSRIMIENLWVGTGLVLAGLSIYYVKSFIPRSEGFSLIGRTEKLAIGGLLRAIGLAVG